MSPALIKSERKPRSVWDDTRLVKECLAGNEEAWSQLIDKYKALIYSIPIKYNLPSHEAADVFQSTCMELLTRLPECRTCRIRKHRRSRTLWCNRHRKSRCCAKRWAVLARNAVGSWSCFFLKRRRGPTLKLLPNSAWHSVPSGLRAKSASSDCGGIWTNWDSTDARDPQKGPARRSFFPAWAN